MVLETQTNTVDNTPDSPEQPSGAPEVYVVIAYRYGMRDNHSYHVAVCNTPEQAIDAAEQEVAYRVGTYGCEVLRCTVGPWSGAARGGNQIYYVGSPHEGVLGKGCEQVDRTNPGWKDRMLEIMMKRYPGKTEDDTDDT